MIVGLTGGIGSGKSTIAACFRQLGVPIYNSDVEAKTLMVASEEVRDKLTKLFGGHVFHGEKLNKTLISKMVFRDKEKLNELNQIVHPAVRKHFKNWVAQQSAPYVVQETALIFENNIQDNYDAIILVTAPEHLRIQRVMDRDGVTEPQVKARIKNQLPDKHKTMLANYVIENLELDQTKKIVNTIHKQLLLRVLS